MSRWHYEELGGLLEQQQITVVPFLIQDLVFKLDSLWYTTRIEVCDFSAHSARNLEKNKCDLK